jgi:ammonium transporter Rh
VFKNKWYKLEIYVNTLVVGDFGAGSCMIAFGAILGKADLFQCWVMVTLQVIFYSLNEGIGYLVLGAIDIGGSMYIHTFGCYFGLAASYFFNPKRAIEDKEGRGVGGYNSQLIAMVGTLFLYMYWPSFNAALAPALTQQRVVINTAMAISSSCICACGVSRLIHYKLEMEIVLNATVAGGVAIGACTDMVVSAGLATLIGGFAGTCSALGFAYLNKFLQRKTGLHDTCGVHNLHGIPGIIGGVVGAIAAASSGKTFND